MPEEKLNLLKFPSGGLAKSSAGPAQIMRGDVRQPCSSGRLPDDVPDSLL